jgi:Mg-chelatase subunit ChlD
MPAQLLVFPAFDHRARIMVMTKQSEEVQNQVAMLQVGGSTALLDAVALAMNEMGNAHNRRKAIVIISDGDDNSSRSSMSEQPGSMFS